MKKSERMSGVMPVTGISFLVWMLASICACGMPDPPLEKVSRFECDFFQEWRELMKNITAAELLEGAATTAAPLTNQEFEYQHAMLMCASGVSGQLSSVPVMFQITKQTLQRLHDLGIPDELVRQLQLLEGQQFAEQAVFWKTIEQSVDQTPLTPDQTLLQYQTTILASAVTDQILPGTPHTSTSFQTFSAHLSPDSQENMAGWNALLFYPKAMKKALSSPGPKPVTRSASYVYEEDDEWWNLRALLKRWGLPKPSTLILIGIGLYLVLALLNRR